MSAAPQPNILRVSLEPHLVEKLRPLVLAIPAPLSAELTPLLSEATSSSSSAPTRTISHALLSSLSKWTRTEEGTRELKSKDPPLDPRAYSMVALLAGTRTSPDKKFPQPPPSSRSGSSTVARDISDRRAVIAVLNALLSVICTGAAIWWAAQRTGWRDEWVRVENARARERNALTLTCPLKFFILFLFFFQKVLLSFSAATIVAMSEVGLYIIWESRGKRSQPAAKVDNVDRGVSHDGGRSVGKANSGDAGEEMSSKPARLGDVSSQASTSIDPHQSSEGMALRQRVGTTSEPSPR